MSDIFDMIYVEGDILSSMLNLFIFSFSLDFVLTFARCVMQIGRTSRD